MKRTKNKAFLGAIVMSLLLIPSTSFAYAPSQIEGFSTKELSKYGESAVQFLTQNDVAKDEILQMDAETVQNLKQQAEANHFTKEQVQAYVEGQINYKAPEELKGVLSDDGTYSTYEDGSTLPNLSLRYGLKPGEQLKQETVVGPLSYTGSPRDVVNANDQSGVYYAVKGETGYTETTTFATVPTVSNVVAKDRPYMFLAANSFAQGNSLTVISDFGVVYMPGDGVWKPFINLRQWNNSTQSYNPIVDTVFNTPIALGSKVYLHFTLTNGTSTDTIKFEVLDGNNFSNVYLSKSYSVSGNPVQPNATNLNIYHETTMAQVLAGSTLDANTGSKMSNAQFSQAYLYKSGTPSLWSTAQTNDVYRQAPTSNKLNCVILNNITNKWHTDDITIYFNRT